MVVALAVMVWQMDLIRRVAGQRMACFSVFIALPSATLRTMATAPCQVHSVHVINAFSKKPGFDTNGNDFAAQVLSQLLLHRGLLSILTREQSTASAARACYSFNVAKLYSGPGESVSQQLL